MASATRTCCCDKAMKTLVIGLGNPILTDDGAGIYAARVVEQLLPADTIVDVVELAVGGLQLMEAMVGYERVIVIDALWSPDDALGEIVTFDAGQLPETMNTASAHDVDLPTALKVGRRLGASLPADEQIQVVGIRARNVLTFGSVPTPAVASAIPSAAAAVLDMLGCDGTADLASVSLESCWRL